MSEVYKLTVLGDDLTERTVELTPYYKEKIDSYLTKIDLNNTSSMQYGIVGQNKLGSFSEAVLKQMRSRNTDGIDTTLSVLVSELKNFDKSIRKWRFSHLFESVKNRIIRINDEYEKIEKTVKGIELQLEKQYETLSVDLKLLEKMFEQNKQCFEDLSLYIYAGELKLKDIEEKVLPELKREAHEKNDPDLIHRSQVLEEQSLRLDRRVHNLKLSKVVSMQLASQIRLIQSNNTALSDKLYSCMVNTLPLWRNQMILSLNIANSQQALDTQNTISKLVNRVLKKNSKVLNRSSSEIARESEKDIVNISTLQQLNKGLISTVHEVLNTQQEARLLRSQAESDLVKSELELSRLSSNLNTLN